MAFKIIAEERDKYKKALEDIKKHLETIMNKSALQMSGTYRMVCRALDAVEDACDIKPEKPVTYVHERKPDDPTIMW